MVIKRLIKAVLASTLIFSMVGCAKEEPKPEPISILCPQGAPALATLGTIDNEMVTIDCVQGTDVLSAELAKKDSEYDIIVAPLNLGTKLYGKTQAFQLDSSVTWGNLFLVGPEDYQGASVAAFGEKAIPQMIFNYVLADQLNETPVTYYASVAEAQQALLTNQAQVALLAQPAATATIVKAKEQGKELTVLYDLQKGWSEKTGSKVAGYPQAAMFVKAENEKDITYVKDAMQTFIENSDEEAIEKAVDEVTAEKLGLPNAKIAAKTFKAQHIAVKAAKEVEDEIKTFLDLFGIELPVDFIIE